MELVVVMMLSSPVETPETYTEELAAATSAYAIAHELMDPREANYVCKNEEDWQKDVDMLRKRAIAVSSEIKLSDAQRFPSREYIGEVLAFNRAYYRHLDRLDALCAGDREWLLANAKKETDLLYKVWDAARDAQCPYYYITIRRQALQNLKDMIGEDNYNRGELPPFVPIWRFIDE